MLRQNQFYSIGTRDQYYKTDFAVTQFAARFWCIIWGAKWACTTYLYLHGSIWITLNWCCKLAGTNSNHASKFSRNFTAVVLRQLNKLGGIGPRTAKSTKLKPSRKLSPRTGLWRPLATILQNVFCLNCWCCFWLLMMRVIRGVQGDPASPSYELV